MSSLAEIIRQKQQELEAKKAQYAKFESLKAGTHIYRIMPSWRQRTEPNAEPIRKAYFWHDFGMHWLKADPESKKPEATYICHDKTFGEPCEICAAIGRAVNAAATDSEIELAKSFNSAQRYLVNMIQRDGAEPTEPKLFELPAGVFEAILKLSEDYGDVTDLSKGTDLKITREGTGKNTKYTVLPVPPGKLPAIPESVMEKLENIDAVVAQKSPAKEQMALNAMARIMGVMPASAPRSNATLLPGRAASAQLSEAIDDAPFDIEPVGAAAGVVDDDMEDILADLLKTGG